MATKADTEALSEEIAALKRDVAAMTEGIQNGDLRKYIDGTVAKLTEEATKLYGDVSERGKQQVDTLSQSIEEKPLQWVLGAFAVGFLTSLLFGGRR
jgi:ElaB/YqjD/DUF883 family membrane-anchored ribosome-binding protein